MLRKTAQNPFQNQLPTNLQASSIIGDNQIKNDYESQYNDRILTMRSFYDMKYQTLFETVKDALDKVSIPNNT